MTTDQPAGAPNDSPRLDEGLPDPCSAAMAWTEVRRGAKGNDRWLTSDVQDAFMAGVEASRVVRAEPDIEHLMYLADHYAGQTQDTRGDILSDRKALVAALTAALATHQPQAAESVSHNADNGAQVSHKVLASLLALIERYEHDGIPNDSLGVVEEARAVAAEAAESVPAVLPSNRLEDNADFDAIVGSRLGEL
jgi:hypothetical protein